MLRHIHKSQKMREVNKEEPLAESPTPENETIGLNDITDGPEQRALEWEPTITPDYPVPDLFLTRYKQNIKQILDWIKTAIIGLSLVLILAGLLYNFFSPPDKDIPQEVLKNLYAFLQNQYGANVAPFNLPIHQSEWLKLNFTKL